ncbi:MAG: hypothetical protein LBV12_02755 [Puniceicoccales bacterium]|jgi:DNA repair exonuclease SbcCD ATPase subunit|nr:hypothetical protein [Puniceicoccales bacterium]
MTEKLRNCPFCGSDCVSAIPKDGMTIDVFCGDCHAEVNVYGDDWNTRPLESALEARVKELQAMLDDSRDKFRRLNAIHKIQSDLGVIPDSDDRTKAREELLAEANIELEKVDAKLDQARIAYNQLETEFNRMRAGLAQARAAAEKLAENISGAACCCSCPFDGDNDGVCEIGAKENCIEEILQWAYAPEEVEGI